MQLYSSNDSTKIIPNNDGSLTDNSTILWWKTEKENKSRRRVLYFCRM